MTELRPEVLLLASRHETGPLARPLLALLDRLDDRGFDGRILCLRGAPGFDRTRIHPAPLIGARFLRTLVLRRLWAEEFARRPRLLHVLDDELAPVGLELAELAGIPYVQSISGFATIERGLKISKRWCRRLAAASRELARELVSNLGVPPELVAVVAPGFATEFDRPPAPGPDQARVIGAVQGPANQGLGVVLEAARLVLEQGFDAEFVIAGSSGQAPPMRRWLDQLGITSRVTIADHPLAALEFWRILDVFCAPGQGDAPSRGLALALAHAVPSIAANVKGLASLIDHKRTGLVVPPNNPHALAAAIAYILDNPREAQTLAQNAQIWVSTQFNPDFEADQIAAIYREILEPSRHPQAT